MHGCRSFRGFPTILCALEDRYPVMTPLHSLLQPFVTTARCRTDKESRARNLRMGPDRSREFPSDAAVAAHGARLAQPARPTPLPAAPLLRGRPNAPRAVRCPCVKGQPLSPEGWGRRAGGQIFCTAWQVAKQHEDMEHATTLSSTPMTRISTRCSMVRAATTLPCKFACYTWEGHTRHTRPESGTRGMRGSKPAGFGGVGYSMST